MKWEKIGDTQTAQGENGKFVIVKQSIYYRASYFGKKITFNLPWNTSIKKVKEMCKNNYYWEDKNE